MPKLSNSDAKNIVNALVKAKQEHNRRVLEAILERLQQTTGHKAFFYKSSIYPDKLTNSGYIALPKEYRKDMDSYLWETKQTMLNAQRLANYLTGKKAIPSNLQQYATNVDITYTDDLSEFSKDILDIINEYIVFNLLS